jgi:hypothetical protein
MHSPDDFENDLLNVLAHNQALDSTCGDVHADQSIDLLAFGGLITVHH